MPIMAYSVTAEMDGSFAAIQRFVIIPLFLFGGAFYPLTQLPTVVQWLAKVFPLWHGVVVARGFTTDAGDEPGGSASPATSPTWRCGRSSAPSWPSDDCGEAVPVSTIFLRIVPVSFITRSPLGRSLRPRRPQRMIERHVVAYRRQWLIVVSGFFEPLFYLLSMRAGVGDLVGTCPWPARAVPYDAFVAPALMASSAMNGAIFDSTGNVLHRLKYARIYDAALATPMSRPTSRSARSAGHSSAARSTRSASSVVMAALGLTQSWWAFWRCPCVR
jgi:hypothetical protein